MSIVHIVVLLYSQPLSSKSLYDVISIVLVKCKIILLFMLSSRKLTSGIAIFPIFTVQTICVKLFSELQ